MECLATRVVAAYLIVPHVCAPRVLAKCCVFALLFALSPLKHGYRNQAGGSTTGRQRVGRKDDEQSLGATETVQEASSLTEMLLPSCVLSSAVW